MKDHIAIKRTQDRCIEARKRRKEYLPIYNCETDYGYGERVVFNGKIMLASGIGRDPIEIPKMQSELYLFDNCISPAIIKKNNVGLVGPINIDDPILDIVGHATLKGVIAAVVLIVTFLFIFFMQF